MYDSTDMLCVMLLHVRMQLSLPPLFVMLGLIRVMAIAHGTKAESLIFCGLVGIMDPPRTSAITFAETMQVRARAGTSMA